MGLTLKKILYTLPLNHRKANSAFFLVTNDTNKPTRCKIKSPAYMHLQLLNYLAHNIMLADLVTLIGTIDIVFGEVDR